MIGLHAALQFQCQQGRARLERPGRLVAVRWPIQPSHPGPSHRTRRQNPVLPVCHPPMDAGQHHRPVAAPVTGGGWDIRPPLGLKWRARGPLAGATRAGPPRRRPDRPCARPDRSVHGRGGPSAKMHLRPTDRRQPRSGAGPCWVRAASGTAGYRWARAITAGMRESQVALHSPPQPRRRSSMGPGSKLSASIMRTAAPGLANRAPIVP